MSKKNKTNFAYLTCEDMYTKLEEGILNQYDIIYTKDSFETYIITENLEAVPIKSKVYAYLSEEEAIKELNKNSDTYEGQLISIYNGNEYEGYIVNYNGENYTVSALSQISSIHYDMLGNRPIENLNGLSDSPIIISRLSDGVYSITGHFKIASNDITTHLNPNKTLFLVYSLDNNTYVKMISSTEIIDYCVSEDSSVIKNKYVTEEFLKENGYVTFENIDEKIKTLELISKTEMSNYVENLIETTFVPLIDERIDKKILGATTEQIMSLFGVS